MNAPCHGGTLPSIRDPVRIYSAHRFCHGLLYSLFFTVYFQYQIDVVHLQPFQLVLMGTVMEVTVFLFEVPTGIVADLYSRRLSVAIGLVMIGASAVLMGAFPQFLTFLVAQIVWGIGETFISGAREAWVADEIPHGPRPQIPATRAFLSGQQGWMAGFVLGMWASIPLGARNLSTPFLIGGVLLVALGIATQFIMSERGFERARDEERSTWASVINLAQSGFALVKARVLFGLIILLVFIQGIASEGLDRLWTQHFVNIGLPPLGAAPQITWWAVMGTAYTALALLITAFFQTRAPLLEHTSIFRVVGVLTFSLSVAGILFAFATNFWFALVAFLLARGIRRTLDPLITAWINHNSESSVRATMLSFQGQAHGVGEVIGGPAAAFVAKVSTVPLALASSAAFLWPSLLVVLKGKKVAGLAEVTQES